MRPFQAGDRVGLKPEVQAANPCHPDRHDNNEADIRRVARPDGTGEVWLDQDLHGRQYWDQSDLVLIKAAK